MVKKNTNKHNKLFSFKEKNSASNLKQKFRALYLKYYEPLCNYAFRYLTNSDEAEDIVQSLMTKVWEQKEKLNNIENIESYLFRAVYNACLNKIQQQKSQEGFRDYNQYKLKLIEMENFEQTFYQWEIKENMDNEIAKLTPRAKQIFEMRFYENMRYKKIAEQLDISERTVETHLQNALKILRKKLKKYI